MIPKHIALKNFLSYRNASLDFSGLHVVCVAGPNGAGKSSLLEAIAWALWGQSRVAADDDIIHQGEMEAQVTFQFHQGDHTYRVIRSRHRSQGTSLEFQVHTEEGWRVLTQRGVRATQLLICRHLRLDYDTFINSAYLRQGGADDFMLKRPGERKQILADLLKLHQYDHLAEGAKEQARQAKAEATLRQTQLDELTAALADYEPTLQRQAQLQQSLHEIDQAQERDRQHHYQLRSLEQTHRVCDQQLQMQRQQHQHLTALLHQTETSLAALTREQQQQDQRLAQAAEIEIGLAELAALEAEDAQLNQHFQRYQALEAQRQSLETEWQAQSAEARTRLGQTQLQLAALQAQIADLDTALLQSEAVDAARQQFLIAKARLKHLDAIQLQAEPLQQRRRQLEAGLQQAQTRLQTRLEELAAAAQQLQQDQGNPPQLVATAQEVSKTLSYLEQRRAYQEQVREKGLERRSFMEVLQSNQRTCETQIAQLGQKLGMLAQPEAVCPLCDRALKARHRALVEGRHRHQQQELQEEIWVIREQLAVSEREIQVLRQEYRAVEAELEAYAPVLQKQGQLTAEMASQATVHERLQALEAEQQRLEQCLTENQYALDLRMELHQINDTLAQLAYDDRNHALTRGQVNRLRWAEIKHHELAQARRRRQQLERRRQQLEADRTALETELAQLQGGTQGQALVAAQAALEQLSYRIDHHQQVRQALLTAQVWRQRYRELEAARQQQPQRQAKIEGLQAQERQQRQELEQLSTAIAALEEQHQALAYDANDLEQLEQAIAARQRQRDTLLAQLGALGQARQHLDELHQGLAQKQQELAAVRQRQRVYQELAQAFGHNGIQALMIENLLPQLEAETNNLLGRLSAHQLHVQFATQRATKRGQGVIDTLDILIADAQGTRPYETYSGGEAFRVNFALRLALARLLAQRSGRALQLLVIDEGFGTQDQQGCDRLIAAINAIAADFACILTVTHVPHFRAAFQTRIDVTKTLQGSQLSLSA
ncbi:MULTISPECIES: SMC family ATPase [Cyanophyceae]|uniref:AAA family ATPase n=1 Tax=Cyanophyceae TaxID=3028117 RepID=UPI0016895B8A|nr:MULTISPECIES: SMC family ATPase [Cyanophyceae]MBD1918687.1 SMC family ATPase [Phormidium sp. FACHB-77]MBD2029106.1 SMC family ATPase [Phormidium sp. FACHB-322]MBD2051306.1 SMC family ATPase [Leptolyngbya sp. FACHB-60]